jgi:hypothetical protein
MIKAFNKRLDDKDAVIKDLIAKSGITEEQPVTKKPKKKPVAKKDEPIKAAFATEEG